VVRLLRVIVFVRWERQNVAIILFVAKVDTHPKKLFSRDACVRMNDGRKRLG